MYAIIKTGGKQYKVSVGDKLNVEKLDAEVGDTVELQAICIVDGKNVEADPEKAGAMKVTAEVIEQFKGEKVVVFKFKKNKNYKKKNGHRQRLTRIEIKSIGDVVVEAEESKAEEAEEAPAEAEPASEAVEVEEAPVEEAATEPEAEPEEAPAEEAAEEEAPAEEAAEPEAEAEPEEAAEPEAEEEDKSASSDAE